MLVPALEAASTEGLKRAVLGGGFALLSRLAVEEEVANGSLAAVPVPDLDLRRELRAVRIAARPGARVRCSGSGSRRTHLTDDAAVADPSELLALAERAARAAGDLLRERVHARGDRARVQVVGHRSGVRCRSRRRGRDPRRSCAATRPDDACSARRGRRRAARAGSAGSIDPLDGTVNFLYGQPTFAVSIACEDDEGPLVGVVHQPIVRARRSPRSAEAGRWRDGVGSRCTGRSRSRRRWWRRGSRTSPHAAPCRARWSRASCRSSATCAARDRRRSIWRGSHAGRLDGYFEHGLNAWDWAAGALLVSEAGGKVLRVPPAGGLPDGLVAGAPDLVDALAELLDDRDGSA